MFVLLHFQFSVKCPDLTPSVPPARGGAGQRGGDPGPSAGAGLGSAALPLPRTFQGRKTTTTRRPPRLQATSTTHFLSMCCCVSQLAILSELSQSHGSDKAGLVISSQSDHFQLKLSPPPVLEE